MSLYANVAQCTEHITNRRKTTLMRKTIKTILLIAAMGGLTTATYAQTIVVAGDNFDADPLGGYGQVAYDFGPPAGFSPQISISTDNPEGTNTQNCAITFNCVAGETLNFGLETAQLTCTNNTNINLYAYILNSTLRSRAFPFLQSEDISLALRLDFSQTAPIFIIPLVAAPRRPIFLPPSFRPRGRDTNTIRFP